MVGRVGVEPTTSRLSGVRSNHLSYRPPPLPKLTIKAAGGVSQLRRTAFLAQIEPPLRGYDPQLNASRSEPTSEAVFQDEGT